MSPVPESMPAPDFFHYHDDHFSDKALQEIFTFNVKTVIDYVRSMGVVYQAAIRDNPDMVFFPDRGAGPLMWTIEAYESKDNAFDRAVRIPKTTLPIGTTTTILNARNSGVNEIEKTIIIREELKRLRDNGLMPQECRHVVLIDEAQSGTTSAQATKLLKIALGENPPLITYIACKDERSGIKIRPATYPYKSMVSGEISGIEGFSIPIPMFYIDSAPLLDIIVKPEVRVGSSPENWLKMLTKIHNTGARDTFQNITLLVLLPELINVALDPNSAQNYKGTNLEELAIKVKLWVSDVYKSLPIDTNLPAKTVERNQNKRFQVAGWFRRMKNTLNLPENKIW